MSMKSFIICTTQRSGSTFFCETLKETNRLGKPNENLLYHEFDINSLGKIDKELKKLSLENALGEISINTSTKNGVCCFKLMMSTLLSIMEQRYPLCNGYKEVYSIFNTYFYNPKYIFLTRKNKIKQAISHAYLRKTGIAHANSYAEASKIKKIKSNIVLRNEDIYIDLLYILDHEKKWADYFLKNNISPLLVEFEDYLNNRNEKLINIADLIDINNDFVGFNQNSNEPIKKSSSTNKEQEASFIDYLDKQDDDLFEKYRFNASNFSVHDKK